MPAPPSRSKTDAKNASVASRSVGSQSSRSSGNNASRSSTGSGNIGSKGGGASKQAPGAGTKAKAGAQAGRVTQSNLGQATQSLSKDRSTALGRVAQAARQNTGPITSSNAADPGFRGLGGPSQTMTRSPVLSSNMGEGFASRPTQKTNWQTRPGAMVMGSPATERAMNPRALGLPKQATTAMQKALDPQVSPTKTVNYLDNAAKAIGLNERDKLSALQSYLRDGGVNLDPATTAWCAAFVNATLQKSGIKGTGSLMARSFLNYGQPTKEPKPGDIAVFSRGAAPYGHVGFFQGLTPDGKYVQVLGGNQKNAVNVTNYPVSRVLGYRQVPGGTPANGGNIAGAGLGPAGEAQVAGPAMAPPSGPPRNQALQAVAGGLTQPARLGPFQGPRMPGDPAALRGIPTPQSIGSLRPSSFISGDPRAAMRPGAFPQARMQSPVMGDPRVGTPPGAFPRARMQSQVMGDPRASMPSGAFPAARMQSPVMGDPRANMAPGAYPAAPVRFAPPSDPRVGMPGSYPAARMQSPVMNDPRVNMPPGAYFNKDQSRVPPTFNTQMVRPQVPGSYPTASPSVDPQAALGFTGMPPMGGAVNMPPAAWSEFNEFATKPRTPPAAPHMGTPASQTAETEPSFWQQGAGLFKQASTAVTEQLEENKKAVKEIEKKYGPLTPEKVKMWAWINGLGGGGAKARPSDIGSNSSVPRQQMAFAPPAPPPPPQPNYSAPQLMSLLDAMRSQGATPEEIAFVESLVSQSAPA